METNEEKLLRLEYYQEILLSVINLSHPFYSLVMSSKLSKEEIEEIFQLCGYLESEYKVQKEEGFVSFVPLLTRFVGMLNYKLDPQKTIEALYDQGFYRELMMELIKARKYT